MKDCNMESPDNDFIQKITDSKWLNYLKGIIASSVHIFIITSFFWISVLSFNRKTLWIFLFGTFLIIAIILVYIIVLLRKLKKRHWEIALLICSIAIFQ